MFRVCVVVEAGHAKPTSRRIKKNMTMRAPTPTALADAWIARYGQAVKDAAGRDGRLSRAEAARMAQGTPEQQQVADNVAAFFDRTGQQTVSAERFLAAERARIVDEAGRVAGRGNTVSLLEARQFERAAPRIGQSWVRRGGATARRRRASMMSRSIAATSLSRC